MEYPILVAGWSKLLRLQHSCIPNIEYVRGMELAYSEPGKPQQNSYAERFNSAVCYEWLL